MRWETYKPAARVTLTAGMRTTWNTNAVNQQKVVCAAGRVVSRSLPRPRTTPRSSDPNRGPGTVSGHALAGLAAARFGGVCHSTGDGPARGFGLFNDIIPAQIADLAATNAPYSPTFVGESVAR